MTQPFPSLTVLAAARDGEGDVKTLLDVLGRQLTPGVEVLVADGGGGAEYPEWVRSVSLPGALTPQLWALGLHSVMTSHVALTTAALQPDENWVAEAQRAAELGAAAVGGAVEPSRHPGMVGWSILFVRYSPNLRPVPAGTQPPGDNAVYRMDALRRHEALWSQDFSEPWVHAALLAEGENLLTAENLVVTQGNTVRLRHFSRARFAHGREYGRKRSQGRRRPHIAADILSTPLVPLLMTVRAARQVMSRRRLRLRFSLCLPLIMWFYGFWAAGECVGRCDQLRRRADHR